MPNSATFEFLSYESGCMHGDEREGMCNPIHTTDLYIPKKEKDLGERK